MSSPILNGQQLPQTSHVTNTTNHTQLQMDGMNIDNEIVIPSEAWILTGSRQASTRTRQTRVDLNRPATDTIIGSEVLNRISSARRQYSSEASNQNYNRRQTLPDSSISVKKIRTNRKIVTNPNAVSSMEDGSTIGTRIPVVSAVRSQQAWGEIMDREHEMEQRTISDSNNNLTSNSIRRSLINVMRNAVGGYGTVTGETQGRFHPMMMTAASITGESSSGSNEEIFNSFVMQLANNNTSGFQTLVDGTTGRLGFPPALPSTRNNINNLSSTRNNTNHNNSSIRRSTQEIDRIGNSPLRHKIVYQLRCKFCLRHACNRAMRAILLADTKVELYSTDIPPAKTINLSEEDRMTQGCNCRIRDTACTGCGNVLGYHVSQPCDRCLEAKNNGHFWMFYSETIHSYERPDPLSVDGKPLYWGSLSPMRETHLITSADGQSSSHAFISTGDIDGILFAGSEASASAMHCLIRYETYCR